MFFCLVLRAGVFDGVGLCIFLEVGLGVAVDPEVGEEGLVAAGLCLPDVGHLDRLLPQLPLVPAVIRVDILLHEVHGCLDALVHHKFVLDATLDCLVDQTQFHLC